MAPTAAQSAPSLPAAAAVGAVQATVAIVVPVYNEERVLAESVRRLHDFLSEQLPFAWRIVIADNASTDAAPAIGRALADDLDGVELLRLERKGRGRALRTAWSGADADVLAYMDVDLSTDLRALLPLLAPLASGHSDVAIGTRLARGSRVTRGPKRELISRGYNLILRATLGARFSDAQCGFKAIRADAAARLLPEIRDEEWFFDTELLVAAQRAGLRIHEVPVDWVDDPDSRVDIVRTALDDLRGIARLLAGAPVARFLAIGAVSTVLHVAIFLALLAPLGAAAANLAGLALTAVANTQANRRLTFGIRGRAGLARHHLLGGFVFVLTLALTNGALELLYALDPSPPALLQAAVLAAASVCATVTRFVALKGWVFARRRRVQIQSLEGRTTP